MSNSASLALGGVGYVKCHVFHGVHWDTETSGFWILTIVMTLFYLLLFFVSNNPLCIMPLCHWCRHNSEAKQRKYLQTHQELPEPTLDGSPSWSTWRAGPTPWSSCEAQCGREWKGPCRDQRPMSAQKPRTEGKRQSSLYHERSICCWRDRNVPLTVENQPRVCSVCLMIQDTRVPGDFCVLNWRTFIRRGCILHFYSLTN